MKKSGLEYTVASLVWGGLVAAGGALIVGGDRLSDVAGGAALGVLLQVVIFWTLFVWALPGRIGLAHGVGSAIRLMFVVLMAFGGVGTLGLEPAPSLLALVVCLFGTTVIEPLVLRRQEPAALAGGAAPIRT